MLSCSHFLDDKFRGLEHLAGLGLEVLSTCEFCRLWCQLHITG